MKLFTFQKQETSWKSFRTEGNKAGNASSAKLSDFAMSKARRQCKHFGIEVRF